MKTKCLHLSFFIVSLFFCSCTKDFVATELKDKIVVLVAPQDNYQGNTTTLLFWWDEVDGAKKYNLQIVKPDFSSPQQLVLDTNVTSNKFTFTLVPGNTYQWRVKAFNNASKTVYSTHTLTLDSLVDLSKETVVLLSPVNNLVTDTMAQTFKWDTVSSAVDYRFQVKNSVGTAVIDITQIGTIASYTLNPGAYTWQVRAQNATSNSAYFSRIITVDTAAPVVSAPVLPANADSSHSPVSIVWTRNSSGIGDSLFIDTDSLFVAPLSYTGYTTSTAYSFTAGVIGRKYYWRLKTNDAAGNWSGYSAYRRFKVY